MITIDEYFKLVCANFPADPSQYSPEQHQCVNRAYAYLKFLLADPVTRRFDCGKHAHLVWVTLKKGQGCVEEVIYDLKRQKQLLTMPFEINKYD